MRIRGYKLSVTAQIGIVIVVINLLVALLAPLIAPFDQATPLGDAWADPDSHHWLGLDNLGRDIVSRLIYGARMSIGLALIITALSFVLGVITGFAAVAVNPDKKAPKDARVLSKPFHLRDLVTAVSPDPGA